MRNPEPTDKNGIPFRAGDIVTFDERLGWGPAEVILSTDGRLCTRSFSNGLGMLLDDEHAPFWIRNYGIEIWAYCVEPSVKMIEYQQEGR
jgi:hypothetical protein